ncbi:MAG: DUF151 domain-containing protein [bacterium]|nr:DUF151 domain-containing protein [bacterium]
MEKIYGMLNKLTDSEFKKTYSTIEIYSFYSVPNSSVENDFGFVVYNKHSDKHIIIELSIGSFVNFYNFYSNAEIKATNTFVVSSTLLSLLNTKFICGYIPDIINNFFICKIVCQNDRKIFIIDTKISDLFCLARINKFNVFIKDTIVDKRGMDKENIINTMLF